MELYYKYSIMCRLAHSKIIQVAADIRKEKGVHSSKNVLYEVKKRRPKNTVQEERVRVKLISFTIIYW
jgi:hypothetical protein